MGRTFLIFERMLPHTYISIMLASMIPIYTSMHSKFCLTSIHIKGMIFHLNSATFFCRSGGGKCLPHHQCCRHSNDVWYLQITKNTSLTLEPHLHQIRVAVHFSCAPTSWSTFCCVQKFLCISEPKFKFIGPIRSSTGVRYCQHRILRCVCMTALQLFSFFNTFSQISAPYNKTLMVTDIRSLIFSWIGPLMLAIIC